LKNYERAENLFKRALNLNPDAFNTLISLAKLYHQQKEYSLAIKIAKEAIDKGADESILDEIKKID